MKKNVLIYVFLFIILISYGFGLVIENFDSKNGFEKSSDATVEMYISTSGYDNKSIRMYYDITTGNWAQVYKDYSVQDWSGGDTLKFWFYGAGGVNNLELKLEDADGSVFIKTLTGVTNNNSWTKFELPISDFVYGWGGNSTLDKTKIKTLSIGVTKNQGGSGYVDIDNIILHLSTPVIKVLDNFDDLNNANNFGGTNSVVNSTCSVAYISTITANGTAGAAELSFNVGAGDYVFFVLPLNGANISSTTHLSFYIKGFSNDEKLKIKFENYGWQSEKDINDYLDVSTDWQKVEIPLSDFTKDGIILVSTDTVNMKLVFAIGTNVLYSSKIYIDEIKFLVPGVAGTDVKTIDSMDDTVGQLSSWSKVGDAAKSLETVGGYLNNAIRINYDFTSSADTWALIQRNLSLNFSYYTHLQLKYKGDLNDNNIEIKLTDSDETIYYKKLFNISSTSAWQTVKVPLKEFSFFKKEDEIKADTNFNLKEISKIWLVISKGSSVSGENKGSVYFDNLELIQESEFKTKTGNIENFEVKNNPFSPNGDRTKDKVYFVYKLKDFAEVKLEIYNLRGELIKSFSEGEKQPNQEFSIEWDGKDSENKLLKNGIYVYRFVIKLLDGKQEEIKHIVGIIK